jgi:speckle-type POZ protein
MKDRESELNEKISFLSSFIALFKDQILTDIQLKPGNDGPSISAHRALLVSSNTICTFLLLSTEFEGEFYGNCSESAPTY